MRTLREKPQPDHGRGETMTNAGDRPFAFSPGSISRQMASGRSSVIAPPGMDADAVVCLVGGCSDNLTRSDVKYCNNDTDDRGNQRADSDVESPTRVIESLLFAQYPLSIFFFEPFSDELLLGLSAGDK